MKKIYKSIIVLLISLIIAGCTYTELTSYIDPNFKNGQQYSKIMILAPFKDINSRLKVEQTFVNEFFNNNYNSIASIDIFPPTREFTADDIKKVIEDNKIDGILELTITDANQSTKQFSTGNTTTGQATAIGNSLYYSFNTKANTFNITYTNVKFELTLLDVATGKTAWIASAYSQGRNIFDIKELITSLSLKTIAKLKEDGFINITSPNNDDDLDSK